jgi:iron complex outermembrane receptor protein
MRKLIKVLLPVSAVVLGFTGFAATAQAQGADEAIEEIVTTGVRGRPRTAVDSAVPVDTFNADQIEAVASADTVDIIQTLVPSYNASRQPISDGATFIRPAELRGLPSHHTLVLVNGKRRHRAALVSIGGSGTQGPDVATIPSTALKNVEVLRDGASSLYGSDAIAGVINFILKDDNEGFSLSAGTGEYYEGDGTSYRVAANLGLPLTENGFLSLSAEVEEADTTERAIPYCESWFCIDPSNPIFATTGAIDQAFVTGTPDPAGYGSIPAGWLDPYILAYPDASSPLNPHNASVEGGTNVMPWGQPNRESFRTFANAGIDLGNDMELYGWANYSTSKADGGFYHRYPFNGTIEPTREADGSVYWPMDKFRSGFTPRFEGEIEDIGVTGGIRGGSDAFTWDVSGRYGSDEIDYRLFNTVNPSMGAASPTDFKPGKLQNEEVQFQVDLTNSFDVGTASDMVLAYGVSYMDETYNVHQSADQASYLAGPHSVADPYDFCTDEADPALRTPTAAGAAAAADPIWPMDCTNTSDPVYTVVGVGANGFPGYSPQFSDEYNRDSYAVYGEISTDVTDNFFIQAAVRYEDYSDFGNETVGKLAGRFRVNDNFAIRGSFGTGFRAPTPGQQGTTNVSTRLPNGIPVATGLFPASGPVAQALGAVPLKAETSTSYTLGVTADVGELTFTVDYFSIEIDDRFRAISTLDVSADPLGDPDAYARFLALEAAGVAGANSIGGVNYFQNAIDTTTTGLDIVASYPIDWGNGQDTSVSFALNWYEEELDADPLDILNAEDEYDLENYDPNVRFNLTAMHTFNEAFSLMGRVRYYGEADNSNSGGTGPNGLRFQVMDSVTYFDLEGSYRLNDNWRFTVGARNLFDEYPPALTREIGDDCCGEKYSSGIVAPWQGGYWYGRITADF